MQIRKQLAWFLSMVVFMSIIPTGMIAAQATALITVTPGYRDDSAIIYCSDPTIPFFITADKLIAGAGKSVFKIQLTETTGLNGFNGYLQEILADNTLGIKKFVFGGSVSSLTEKLLGTGAILSIPPTSTFVPEVNKKYLLTVEFTDITGAIVNVSNGITISTIIPPAVTVTPGYRDTNNVLINCSDLSVPFTVPTASLVPGSGKSSFRVQLSDITGLNRFSGYIQEIASDNTYGTKSYVFGGSVPYMADRLLGAGVSMNFPASSTFVPQDNKRYLLTVEFTNMSGEVVYVSNRIILLTYPAPTMMVTPGYKDANGLYTYCTNQEAPFYVPTQSLVGGSGNNVFVIKVNDLSLISRFSGYIQEIESDQGLGAKTYIFGGAVSSLGTALLGSGARLGIPANSTFVPENNKDYLVTVDFCDSNNAILYRSSDIKLSTRVAPDIRITPGFMNENGTIIYCSDTTIPFTIPAEKLIAGSTNNIFKVQLNDIAGLSSISGYIREVASNDTLGEKYNIFGATVSENSESLLTDGLLLSISPYTDFIPQEGKKYLLTVEFCDADGNIVYSSKAITILTSVAPTITVTPGYRDDNGAIVYCTDTSVPFEIPTEKLSANSMNNIFKVQMSSVTGLSTLNGYIQEIVSDNTYGSKYNIFSASVSLNADSLLAYGLLLSINSSTGFTPQGGKNYLITVDFTDVNGNTMYRSIGFIVTTPPEES